MWKPPASFPAIPWHMAYSHENNLGLSHWKQLRKHLCKSQLDAVGFAWWWSHAEQLGGPQPIPDSHGWSVLPVDKCCSQPLPHLPHNVTDPTEANRGHSDGIQTTFMGHKRERTVLKSPHSPDPETQATHSHENKAQSGYRINKVYCFQAAELF